MSVHHQRGGYARAAALTPERRAEIARMGGRAKAARALTASVVRRIMTGIGDARAKGVAYSSYVFWPLNSETLFSIRASAEDAWALGVMALRVYRSAGLDAAIHLRTAGTYCEATVERARPVVITSEVHDDPV